MSGIPFLDELPSGWVIQPAIALAETLTSTVDKKEHEGEQRVLLCNYTDVYYGDRIVDPSSFMVATASDAQISAFSVRAGDVPFTKDSETSDDIGIPAYIPNDLPGVVYGYHLSIYRARDRRYGRFMRYLLESSYAKATFKMKTPGVTRVGLSRNTVNYFRVPTPPAEDAVRIADYLDRETAQVDNFVAENEKLIALLAERRAAVIARGVTKGLDPKVPMQDSGVEWLGMVPEGWDTLALRHLLSGVDQGSSPQGEAGLADGRDQFGVLKSGCVNGGVFRATEHKLLSDDYVVDSEMLVYPGDLLVNRASGSISLLGSAGIVTSNPYKLMLSDKTFRFRTGFRTSGAYLYWLLNSRMYRAQVEKSVSGAEGMANNIPLRAIRAFVFPVPPLNEQRRIIDYLDKQTARIDKATTTARRAIALAKERRAALISAAVTGKIQIGAGAT